LGENHRFVQAFTKKILVSETQEMKSFSFRKQLRMRNDEYDQLSCHSTRHGNFLAIDFTSILISNLSIMPSSSDSSHGNRFSSIWSSVNESSIGKFYLYFLRKWAWKWKFASSSPTYSHLSLSENEVPSWTEVLQAEFHIKKTWKGRKRDEAMVEENRVRRLNQI